MRIIGVDPGISGAIAFYSQGRVMTYDLPVWAPTGKKKTIDALHLGEILDESAAQQANLIVLEQGQSMPNQSSPAGFNYGRACGLIEATLYHCTSEYCVLEYVTPSVWKRKLGLLSADKKASLDMCRRLFPQDSMQFTMRKDHNKAEAALLAYYGAKYLTESYR